MRGRTDRWPGARAALSAAFVEADLDRGVVCAGAAGRREAGAGWRFETCLARPLRVAGGQVGEVGFGGVDLVKDAPGVAKHTLAGGRRGNGAPSAGALHQPRTGDTLERHESMTSTRA